MDAPLDPDALRAVLDRDAARTPMPWTAAPNGGFTAPGIEPWLPVGDVAAVNVAAQEADPGSVLHLVRALLRLRRAVPDLRRGDDADLTDDLVPGAAGVWTFRRGRSVQVVLNFGVGPVEVPVAVPAARLACATDRAGEGSPVGGSGGSVVVAPGRGIVVVGD